MYFTSCYRKMVLILNGMMLSTFVTSVLTKAMLTMILYWFMEMLVNDDVYTRTRTHTHTCTHTHTHTHTHTQTQHTHGQTQHTHPQIYLLTVYLLRNCIHSQPATMYTDGCLLILKSLANALCNPVNILLASFYNS